MQSSRDSTMNDRTRPYTTDYHQVEIGDHLTRSLSPLQDNESFFGASRYSPVSQVLPEDTVQPSGNPDVKNKLDHKQDTVVSSTQSKYESGASVCTWSIGWRTPCLMLLPFFLGESFKTY